MEIIQTTKQTKGIHFKNPSILNPEQLIGFSQKYKRSIPDLKKYLKLNEGRIIDNLVLCRISSNGKPSKKTIKGKIVEVTDKNFTFMSNQNFSGEYDVEQKLLIHFDNVWGDVPMIDFIFGNEEDPFVISNHKDLKSYYRKLLKIRKLLSQYVGKQHVAKLFFFSPDKITEVECEILTVNKSNVEVRHIRTSSGKNGMIDLHDTKKVIRFVKPEGYLYSVYVFNGTKSQTNFFDDGSYE